MTDCLHMPDRCDLLTEDGFHPMRKDAGGFSFRDVRMEAENREGELNLRLTAGETPLIAVIFRWKGSWLDGCRFFGDAVERGYGDLGWQCMNPQRLMPWYFAASDGQRTLTSGVMTGPDAFCFWQCDEDGATLWMDVRCGGQGVVLLKRWITPARIRQTYYTGISAYQAMRMFCRKLCDTPLLPSAPVYGSNNWYYSYGRTSERELLRSAVETSNWCEGLSRRPYMVVDDGWQELADIKKAAGRPYRRGNERFPNMSELAKRILDTGCQPGIWFRPLENNDRFWKGASLSDGIPGVIDCSTSENLEAIAQDTARLAAWGYQLIKYDFVCHDLLGQYIKSNGAYLKSKGRPLAVRHQTTAAAIRKLCAVIRANAGGALLIGCNVPGHCAAGELHICRGGDDTSGLDWDRTLTMGVNTLAFRLCQHNAFYAMDADCVGVAPEGIAFEQNRQFMDLISRSGTPFFVSVKPNYVTSDMEKEIHEAFARADGASGNIEPLDWMDSMLPRRYQIDDMEKTYRWLPDYGLRYPGQL